MVRRFTAFARAGRILLVVALFAQLLSTAAAFSNGQAASLVLGQATFTSGTGATTQSGMSNPSDLAVDPISGKVFVADSGNNRVLRFASGAALVNGAAADGVLGQADFTSNAAATTQSGMNKPTGVAVDSAGRLWVADFFNRRVLRFDGAASKANGTAAEGVLGQPDFTSSTAATTANGMGVTTSVTVDSAGHLWVADFSNHRVLRFDGAASKANGAAAEGVLGQPDFTSSAPATTAGGMNNPIDMAVDSAGRLWVADFSNHRVLRFNDAAGTANGAAAEGVLGQPDFSNSALATTASGMYNPHGVALDSADNLLVADSGNNRVLRFEGAAGKANGAAADGVLGQSTFTSSAFATTASAMNNPTGVALDSAGNLWVAETQNNRALRFDKLPQTITFGALATKIYGAAAFTVSASASSGLAVTFTSTTLAVCTVSGSTVTLLAAGACTLAADQAGDLNYSAAPQVPQTFTVSPASQTIAFGALATKIYGAAAFTVSASASSGLAVTFTSSTLAVCTVSGSTVTLLAAGACTLAADQAGDSNYSAAPQVPQTFTVSPASQTIAFGALATKIYGAAAFTISASASSGLAVTFTSTTPAVCTVSGSTVTLLAAGACTLAADQAGDSNYSAAPQVSQTFTVSPASQTIAFGALATKTVGAPDFAVSASASSGLAVTFTSSTLAVCTVSSSTVTLLAAGICTIRANQAGNASYSAAAPVAQSFTVSTDSDGDGIPDNVECPTGAACVDSDGDSTPDSLDSDSDNDGVPDQEECSSQPCRDSDGDDKADYRDSDDDGDGIITDCPVPVAGQECKADEDGDGIPADLDPNDDQKLPNGGDSDGDSIPDNVECSTGAPCRDSDGDSVPDYRDTDSDNDGILDSAEVGSDPLHPIDSDGDGIPDYLDQINGTGAYGLYLPSIGR